MSLKRFALILSLLIGTLSVSRLTAQVDTATVVGTVLDSSGAVVPAASVTATAVGTNIKTSTRTDASGNYVITPLKIGEYSVAVEAQGFKKETRARVVLQVQDRLRVDFTLQVGALTEAVNIEAEVPVVQTESSALGDVIGSRQITDLPLNGRDYTQLATLTTGVAKITENGGGINGSTTATNGNAGGAFAVNGTRGNLNNFMLDGVDNNSNDNAGNILRTSVDAIEEFKVQTSNYSAEFGRSGGAVINATIKSGTNEFHGTAFEFLRNSALDARGFFEQPDQPKAPFKQNQFGGTLGGPIKKNKLFFFGDYQGTRVRAATTDIVTVPTPAEINGDFSGAGIAQIFDPATLDPKTQLAPAFCRQCNPAVSVRFDRPQRGSSLPGAERIRRARKQLYLQCPGPRHHRSDGCSRRLQHLGKATALCPVFVKPADEVPGASTAGAR